ncbi:hypothetical protein L4C31_23195 [Aliivibrio sifiae]
MNIGDFILTVLFSGFSGIIIGYFLRDISAAIRGFYNAYIRKPKHLVKYNFEDNGNVEK